MVRAYVWQVDVVDAQGAFVDDATNVVTFSLSGAGTLAGTANGDPAGHENNLSPTRPAYWGKVLAVVVAGDESGLVRPWHTCTVPLDEVGEGRGGLAGVNVNLCSLGLSNATEEQQVHSAMWGMPMLQGVRQAMHELLRA